MAFLPDHTVRIDFQANDSLPNLVDGLEYWQKLGLIQADSLLTSLSLEDRQRAAYQLELRSEVSQQQLLQGLKQWQALGLFLQLQIQGWVAVNPAHPAFLQGLEDWLNRQLITDTAIRRLSQTHLTCTVTLAAIAPPLAPATAPSPIPEITSSMGEAQSASIAAISPRPEPSPNWVTRTVRSLMAELSVVWLLLLGVILVLLSSGVLVANQWQRFPAAGQYGILWLYSLAFGLAALWCRRQPHLNLTAQALRIATLLLIPLNFVAMDGFRLWQGALGLGIIGLASLSLGGLMRQLDYPLQREAANTSLRHPWRYWLLLSLVHWGWSLTFMPTLAVYLGITGVMGLTLLEPPRSDGQSVLAASSPDTGQSPTSGWSLDINRGLVVYGLVLLLLRALAVALVPPTQLGLAIGLGGFWLLWQLEALSDTASQPAPAPVSPAPSPRAISGSAFQPRLPHLQLPWPHSGWLIPRLLGWGLLLLGWSLTVASLPWQALAVSGLAGLLVGRAVLRTWSRVNLNWLLLIGLQMVWLAWEMLPESGQAYTEALGERLVGSQGQPWAALGLVFFPYLMVVVGLSDWLARRHQRQLARYSGSLALGLGIALAGLAALNPVLRSLNLMASTLLLGVVTRHRWRQYAHHRLDWAVRPQPIRYLATLTHVTGLLALGAAIAGAMPMLSPVGWAVVGLVMMAGEGAFSLGPVMDEDLPLQPRCLIRLLRSSAWPLCLIGAGLTETALMVVRGWTLMPNPALSAWGLMGLGPPILLTLMAGLVRSRRSIAAKNSVVWLWLVPVLVWGSYPLRLVGLGIGTGLMVANTQYLQTAVAAWITVGFGLTLAGAKLYGAIGGIDMNYPLWLLALAIAALLLWIVRHFLYRSDASLARSYCFALDAWGFILSSLTLVAGLVLVPYRLFLVQQPITVAETLSLLVLIAAATYRSWQPANHLPTRHIQIHRFGIVVVLGVQLATQGSPSAHLLSLGLGALALWLQTAWMQKLVPAYLTVGLGLVWSMALVGELTDYQTMIAWLWRAIAAALLWVLHHQLAHRHHPLARLYGKACNGWAIVLVAIGLIVTTGYTLSYIPYVGSYRLSPYFPPSPLLWSVTVLVIMVATAYRSWQWTPRPRGLWLSTGVLLVAQISMIWFPSLLLVSLGAAAAMMAIHSRYLKTLNAALLAISLGLTAVTAGLWQGPIGHPIDAWDRWLVVLAIATAAFWLGRSYLRRYPTRLVKLYRRSLDYWAQILCGIGLLSLTVHSCLVLWEHLPASGITLAAAGIFTAALLLRHWHHPRNWGIYAIGWSLELLVIESLSHWSTALVALAIANIMFGLTTQILGDWLYRHQRTPQMLSSWHILPLIYGALGAVLRTGVFTSWTGLSTLGLVLIAIGVGRRQPAFKPLIYLALVGVSATAFELLSYQLQSLAVGDQLIAIAALAATLLYAYRLTAGWLAPYLSLSHLELISVAHLHWGIGSLLLLSALGYPLHQNALVGLGTGLFLSRYALMQGRDRDFHPEAVAEGWVYLGCAEVLGLALFGGNLLVPAAVMVGLIPWVSVLVILLAALLFGLPWETWGWPPRPWEITIGVLPLAAIAISSGSFGHLASVDLLLAAGFYGFVARLKHRPRLSYLSLLLVNAAVLNARGWHTPFAGAGLLGLSVLYGSWIDPLLKLPSANRLRHYLRVLATGLICIAAWGFSPDTGVVPAVVSLGAILIGLSLRIRAFLYVGTLVFVFNAGYQLILLSFTYPLLKWIIGLVAGLAFIATAAGFETRRAQLNLLLSHWRATLKDWE